MKVINPTVVNAAKNIPPWALLAGAGALGAGALGARALGATTEEAQLPSDDSMNDLPGIDNQELLLKAQLGVIRDRRRKEERAAQKLLQEKLIQSYQSAGY